MAAYRELQIDSNRSSPERNRAVAALDRVALGYDAAMNAGADQLWPDLPVGPGSAYFPSMYYRLRTIAVDWATPGSALSGASPAQTRRAVGRWKVLSNSAQAQAVRLDGQLTAASFFTAGTVDRVQVSGPATALWGRTHQGWTCALADPAQTQGTVRVTVDSGGHRVVHADPTVTVVATRPELVVDIKVAGSFGATHSFTVAR